MILIDAGPLIALLDRDDTHHAECVEAARTLPAGPLATTWPCITEAMYILGDIGGFRYQAELWKLRAAGHLLVLDLSAEEATRAAELMEIYHDLPMDLADATLVAVAEARRWRRLLTLDSDFRVYRLSDDSVLDLIP